MNWTNVDHARALRLEENRIREECAKVAEQIGNEHGEDGELWIARKIADEIRKKSTPVSQRE